MLNTTSPSCVPEASPRPVDDWDPLHFSLSVPVKISWKNHKLVADISVRGRRISAHNKLGSLQIVCSVSTPSEFARDNASITVEKPWKTADNSLVLKDGYVWRAKSSGASGTQVGEVVFNTSLTGYQEILTDPSYAGQFV